MQHVTVKITGIVRDAVLGEGGFKSTEGKRAAAALKEAPTKRQGRGWLHEATLDVAAAKWLLGFCIAGRDRLAAKPNKQKQQHEWAVQYAYDKAVDRLRVALIEFGDVEKPADVGTAATVVVKVPPRFYDDHVSRDLPAGTEIKRGRDLVTVELTADELAELRSDATHYADSSNGFEDRGLVQSARATVKRLAGIEIGR